MRTFIIFAVSAILMVTSCKSGPKSQPAETTEPAQAPAVEKPVELTQELPKWAADYPIGGDSVAIISTKFGDIVLEFFPDVAPNHVRNFKYLANKGFYDGCTFHRVIPNFMIQGGDPNSKDTIRANDGMGGPHWRVNAEFNPKSHVRGTLSMARSQDPNSAGSQFFICVVPRQHLDNQYTVFGRVIKGMDVADTIVGQPRDPRDNPLERIDMNVRIAPRSEVKL